MNRIEALESPFWLQQLAFGIPGHFVQELMNERVFQQIFGESVADYQRMDFGFRNLPALRVFNVSGNSNAQTWYVSGDLRVEVIFPPLIKRSELQVFPDLLVTAILAQLRRPSFFNAMRRRVPGLDQLGFNYTWDKGLGFKAADQEDVAPMTALGVNFRVNKDVWDQHVEANDDREQDSPFLRTLSQLERFTGIIQAMKDDSTTAGVTVTTTGPIGD